MESLDGSEKQSPKWYHQTEAGLPDFSRPMTQAEMVQFYQEAADQHPEMLADLYVNFHEFTRIEFIIFKDRLSAAILVSNATRNAVDAVDARIAKAKRDGVYRKPGWQSEVDDVIEESLGIIRDASQISIGATMLTAVAALEGLLKDLESDAENRDGFRQHMDRFLTQHNATPEEKAEIRTMSAEVSTRRNFFAHTLTGSYFPNIKESELKEPEFRFDVETMNDTLFTVGRIAVALERIIERE